MKQLLASLGIGAATVDTTLHDNRCYPGAIVTGEAIVRGGQVAQQIEQIYLYLRTVYHNDQHSHHHTLARYEIVDPFVVEPGQCVSVDLKVQLPYETPLSMGYDPVYLKTGLDIPLALDPSDSDMLQVEPTPLQEKLFETLRLLGFQLYRTKNESKPLGFAGLPFVQEFELRPSGAYKQHLQEIEVRFLVRPNALDVRLEIDRRVRGLGHLLDDFDLNERRTGLSFTNADLGSDWTPQLAQVLDAAIQSWGKR